MTLSNLCKLGIITMLLGVGACSSSSSTPTPSTSKDATSTVDGTGVSDGTAGNDTKTGDTAATDGTGADASSVAACCKLQKAECGVVTKCGGSCGQCAAGKSCDSTTHKCIVQTVLKKFGESCGPSADCPVPTTQAEVQTYITCLNDQCDSGRCDFGDDYFTNTGVCGMACTISADIKNNTTGAATPDGIEDDVTASDCVGAVDGPAGKDWRCVLASPTGQGTAAYCRAGLTFKPCTGNGDCGNTEVCSLMLISGTFTPVCAAKWKNPNGSAGQATGDLCNNGFGSGPLATCANDLCVNGVCNGFCKTDDDCITAPGACKSGKCDGTGTTCTGDKDCSAQHCAQNQQIIDAKTHYAMCRPKNCGLDKDCADPTTFCGIQYNNVSGPAGDADPNDPSKITLAAFDGACMKQTAAGAKDGEACDPFPQNADASAGQCAEWQLCIAASCSTLCKGDADCLKDQKCATFQQIENVGSSTTPIYTAPQFKACQAMPGATTTCSNTAQCGPAQVCREWTYTVQLPTQASPTDPPGTPTPTTEVLTGGGLCVTPGAKESDTGTLCGSDAGDAECKSGVCDQLFNFTDSNGKALNIGHCLPLCGAQSDCSKGLDLDVGGGKTQHFDSMCSIRVQAYTPIDPMDPFGRVFRSECLPVNTGTTLTDCASDKKCSKAGEACFPAIIANGPDTAAKADYRCQAVVGSTDPVPTGKLGEKCSTDTTKATTCASGLCQDDIGATASNTVGYCSGLCSTNADCASGGADMVCDLQHQWLPRKDASKAAIVPMCVRKKACIPCSWDFQCAGGYACTKPNPNKPTGYCAPTCQSDAECVGADGGGATCDAATGSDGKKSGAKVCTPGCAK